MRFSVFFTTIFFLFYAVTLDGQNVPLSQYESYFLAQNRYPSGASALDWFPDDYEVQGVTNDGSNWFFTIVDQDETHGIMWRIPKGVPLNGNVSGNAGVISTNYFNIPELVSINAWHWGDPDHIRFEGEDYIVVPIYSKLACFKANDLSYVNYADFDGNIAGGGGWCAVGVDNDLYASVNSPTAIVQYDVDWANFINNPNDHDVLSFVTSHKLKKSDGSDLFMTDMQGGEFSTTGEILYLVSGRGACLEWLGLSGAEWTPKDGIHAIVTENWTEIAQSSKSSGSNINFSYDYDPTCVICTTLFVPVGGGSDTPEGLTIWDLEDGSAPAINGSLHVLVDRYLLGDCDDEIFFHHYSAKVHVDKNASGGQGLLGTPSNKFNSVNSAYNHYPIWDGSEMILTPGVYKDTGLYNKRMRITSSGGTVTIGQQ
jgi:hypothetical protein